MSAESWPAQLANLVRQAAELIKPPERLPLSEWAAKYFRLSSESSVTPGEFTPFRFQREVLDAISPHSPYQQVVLMWASQMSKSSMLLAFLANIIKEDPGPVLAVMPNLAMAEMFSKDRIAPMCRDMPVLRGLVADGRSKDAGSSVKHRRFVGGSVSIVGANSAAGLSSRPVRYLLLDEVDRYMESAGAEGDPVALATARTRTFWNRKILLTSSPTAKGASRIESAYLESDQREYLVPCPFCQSLQLLIWERMEWPEGEPKKAAYRCQSCEELIPHHKKAWMEGNGEWFAMNPGAATAGFRLAELVSPWRSWGEIAEECEKAQPNPERYRAFLNTSLCLLWDDQAQTDVDLSTLLARREPFGAMLPAGAAVVTVGVDVQADRLELETVAWGRGEESWSLEYQVIHGDPNGADLWAALDKYLARPWTHPIVGEVRIEAVCIDSGYATEQVYSYCRDRYSRRVFAVKGRAGAYPVWPKKPSRRNVTNLYIVGVDTAKESVLGRLKIAAPGPGYCHFPQGRAEGYFEMLLSEYVATSYRKGRPHREWTRKRGVRAEGLDCRCYAYAAMCARSAMGLRLDAEVDRIEAMVPKPQPAPAAKPVAYQTSKSSMLN